MLPHSVKCREFQGRFLGTGTQISREKRTLAEGWNCVVAGSVTASVVHCPMTSHGCDRQNVE